MPTPPPHTSPVLPDRREIGLWPGSVWLTAQHTSRAQHAGRYTAESFAHPAKMLPAVVRAALLAYTTPGDLVADPMCGIGTTLVEAVHTGRRALGIEYEPRWARVARDNLALAAGQGATTDAEVICDDARRATADLALTHRSAVKLLVTSPPYGASVHGLVSSVRDQGVRKHDHHYSRDPGNLAHHPISDLLAGFTEILRGCLPLLAPAGIVAITTRPFRAPGALRADGELVDFPSLTLDAAINAGLQPLQRCVALLVGIRDARLVSRTSFFHLHNIRQLRDRGIPASVVAHEDLLLLRKPVTQPAIAATQPEQLTAAGAP
jgi:modification methylase